MRWDETDFEEQAKQTVPDRCIARVKNHWDVYEHQCSRKRGHGTNGQWCKQHSDIKPSAHSGGSVTDE